MEQSEYPKIVSNLHKITRTVGYVTLKANIPVSFSSTKSAFRAELYETGHSAASFHNTWSIKKGGVFFELKYQYSFVLVELARRKLNETQSSGEY